MAVLSSAELAALRKDLEDEGVTINYTKDPANRVFQAIEDLFESNLRAAVNNAIETEAPGVFTAAQKVKIFKRFLNRKYLRGG